MAKRDTGIDKLFLKAEQQANDFELFPESDSMATSEMIEGLVPETDIQKRLRELAELDVDEYVAQTVTPAESQSRPSAKDILSIFPGQQLREESMGPLYMTEFMLDFGGMRRRVGIIAQQRTENNGVWLPEHHLRAAELLREFVDHNIPVVTLMDTPGAEAGAEANCNNQAHAISLLIAEFAQASIPTLGVVIGNGYSGGAIPLATTNLLLTVRDGVFNTILPRGLANIARKYNLSWQECAKYVGVSAFELCDQGYVDGIIDYVPSDEGQIKNLVSAITSGLRAIEAASVQFTARNPDIIEHHQRSLNRYYSPSNKLKDLQEKSELSLPTSPTSLANIYGLTYRYMRFLVLRKRITHSTVEYYGNLAEVELPEGDLDRRTAQENREVFQKWLDNPFEIKYDDGLRRIWLKYTDKRKHIGTKRNPVGQFFRGDPDTEWGKAMRNMCVDFAFHLYNLWKDSAANNFMSLIDFLLDEKNQPSEDLSNPTVPDVILQPEVRYRFIQECMNILIFDKLYNNIVANMKTIAREAKDQNQISRDSIATLFEESVTPAVKDLTKRLPKNENIERDADELRERFITWVSFFTHLPRRVRVLKETEQWKKMVFPRVPEPLFAIISFMFERLIPSYLDTQENSNRRYYSKLNIRNIGIKDFWNRLEIAYHDLLIQDVLLSIKIGQKKDSTPVHQKLMDKFFKNFEEIDANLISADPVQFPGFRVAIDSSIKKGVTPSSAITGIAQFRYRNMKRNVGVLISNSSFQAGAWDMAATEKFCRLLVACAKRRIPVVCFVSSGGMNTKEGAGALFSMSICNDRITRFIRDNNLPIMMFGFGDCTGGAQASFVTHPLAQTYYFSGTNMPFAGQVVVPSYLPTYSTLSNYLSLRPGAMQGLVKHPLASDLDKKLRSIDPTIPVPTESVAEVMARVLKGVYASREAETAGGTDISENELRKPVKRVLIHARGCPCVKLVEKAIEHKKRVVLVQSDPDMDSVAAKKLRRQDQLVCIGGSTPDESYLNAQSVMRIAERENCDALHPGIGFLSENPDFADLCRNHGLNFVGPSVRSMEWMGNKSNATNTARRIGVPVVPGSYGVLTDAEGAASVAEEIGYPVILKAVHGGGGKGIKVVKDPSKFRATFLQIAAEAKSAFGSSDIYLEKFVESMRHVEIQILRDSHGNTKVLGLRDCSVQRNNQKVIEESGSTLLPTKLEKVMFDSAAKLADEVDYVGAGTVEFIFSLKDQAVYFMEMNTRLQIEHPVTEKVTNTDIVGAQFEIAGGGDISEMKFRKTGYAIELRITAEKTVVTPDGEVEFVPDPGTVTEYDFPEETHIDVLSAIDEGQVISPYYDSMVIQLICKGKDREDTIDKLLAYLDKVTLKGVCTNIAMLKRILADEKFRGGDYDTGYLPEFLGRIDIKALIAESEEMAGDRGAGFDIDSLRIEDSNEIKVISQSAGVFYTTPSPTEPEFSKVGDVVSVSDTLCLMEAMKLFRPLTLEMYNDDVQVIYDPAKKYKIVRINPANGQAVNKGDLLFVVEPL